MSEEPMRCPYCGQLFDDQGYHYCREAPVISTTSDITLNTNPTPDQIALTQAHVRESDLAVALQAANRDRTQAQARIRELEEWVDTANAKVDRLAKAEARIRELEGSLSEAREIAARNATDCGHLRQTAIALESNQCTPEERAVLDACAKNPVFTHYRSNELRVDMDWAENVLKVEMHRRAELARRAAGKGGM